MKKPNHNNVVDIVEIPADLSTPDFREAWHEWQAFRREDLRKPLTTRMMRGQLRKLASYGGAEIAIATINHCIANGYQGIFPLPKAELEMLKGRAQPTGKPPTSGHREPSELWRDAAKVCLRNEPDYWQHHGIESTDALQHLSFYQLAQPLRNQVVAEARAQNLRIW